MNIMKSGEGLATVTDFINKKFGLDIPKKLKPLAISDLEKFREKYGVKDWYTRREEAELLAEKQKELKKSLSEIKPKYRDRIDDVNR